MARKTNPTFANDAGCCRKRTCGDAARTRFNGVKVFSATMVAERERLGDRITTWLAANPKLLLVEIVVTQSSDYSFHCRALTVFYWAPSE